LRTRMSGTGGSGPKGSGVQGYGKTWDNAFAKKT
jgi:hypothetical protein